MKFTNDMLAFADRFFAELKKLDGDAPAVVENSAVVAEVKTEVEAKTEDVKSEVEVKTEVEAATATAPEANAEVEALKKKVEDLTAELAGMKTNLNSTMEANTELVSKLAVILKTPVKGDLAEVKNSRPAEVKNDFKGWDEAINAKLNIKP